MSMRPARCAQQSVSARTTGTHATHVAHSWEKAPALSPLQNPPYSWLIDQPAGSIETLIADCSGGHRVDREGKTMRRRWTMTELHRLA